MYRQSVILSALLGASLYAPLGSCVTYVADDADASRVASEVAERADGAFTFEQAIEAAYRHNPELRALASRARSAGADLEPFAIQGEYRSGRDMLGVMIDPVALLDLGPRGAANEALDGAAAAAATALVTGRWRVAAELAEVFATEAVLDTLSVPVIDVDPDAFERAGLASAVDAALLRAARAGAIAEHEALRAERERNLARFRRLLGLPADARARIAPSTFGTAPVHAEHALLARPDLTLATARFRVADAEFRAAVAAQYPSLMIGPEFPLSGGPLEWMAVLRLPLGATGEARAAQHRRDAARAELEAAYLDATRQVRDAEIAVTAAQAAAESARLALETSSMRMTAALAALQVEVDAFARVAEAANMVVADTRARRVAELGRRLALLELDVAYGWPAVVTEAGS